MRVCIGVTDQERCFRCNSEQERDLRVRRAASHWLQQTLEGLSLVTSCLQLSSAVTDVCRQ